MINSRLTKIRNIAIEKKVDCILLTDLSNIYYATGFRGFEGIVTFIPIGEEPLLLVPRLEYERAQEETEINVEYYVDFKKKFFEVLEKLKCKNLGISYKHVRYSLVDMIKRKSSSINIADVSEGIANLRAIKELDEIENIKKSVRITEKGLKEALNTIGDGIKEIDVAANAEYAMRINGSEGLAFTSIIASGANSALPHATASHKVLKKGEVVVVDIGAKFQGYCGDLTRTISVSRVSKKIMDMFIAVLEAQKAAIKSVKPGVKASDVDAAARSVIKDYGYDKFFIHNTGHGLGIDVHEAPTIGSKSTIELKPGMVITIEPGIYIKGFAGIRVEDDVLVTDTGHRVLSSFERSLVF